VNICVMTNGNLGTAVSSNEVRTVGGNFQFPGCSARESDDVKIEA